MTTTRTHLLVTTTLVLAMLGGCSSRREPKPARTRSFPIAATSLALRTLPIDEQERLLGPGSPSSHRIRVLIAPEDPVLGDADAAITLIEFSDLSVAPARLAAQTIRALRAQHGDRLRVVFKPMADLSSPISVTAALGALAAMEQGKFWPYHDCLTALYCTDPTPEDIADCAAGTGADLDRFSAVMQDEWTGLRLDAANAYADRVGAEGTPTFFLNGYRIKGVYSIESFQRGLATEAHAVDSLRQRHDIGDGEVYAQIMRGARTEAEQPQPADEEPADPGAIR